MPKPREHIQELTRTLTAQHRDEACHSVQFYENDSFLMESVARYVGAGLSVGERTLLICTPGHVKGIKDLLSHGSLDLDKAIYSGDFVTLDAQQLLLSLQVNGRIDHSLFLQKIGALLERLSAGGKPLRVFGEMVAILAQHGRHADALELESWWNELAKTHAFSLFCAYPISGFGQQNQAEMFRDICALHSEVSPAENYATLIDADDRRRAIAMLQQKSQALDAQAARLKDAENARALLAAIVDSSDDAIVSKSLEGIITSWNAGAQRLFGYTAEETIGKPVSILFPPDRLHEEDQILLRLRSGKRVDHFETVRVAKDGRLLDVSLTISPVRDSSGRLIGASKIARDITERKAAQKMLERQNERLQLLNDAAGHLLAAEEPAEMIRGLFNRVRHHLGVECFVSIIIDEADQGLSVLASEGISDDAIEKLMQMEREQAAHGQATLRRHLTSARDLERDDHSKAQLLRSIGVRTYTRHPLMAGHRLLGTLAFGSRTREAFRDDELGLLYTLCHYASIAIERVKLLKQLREEDKKKNEFLATLAHELRNPMAPLRSSLDLMRIGYQDGATRQQLHEIMARQLNQLTRLVDDLLEMSRITTGKILLRREVVDIASVIRSAVDSSLPMIEKAGHKLTVSLPSEPIMMDADTVRLAQVFVNLLNNAAKYTEDHGVITVSVRRTGESTVTISVRDTGMGIPQDMLPRVFDMFAQVDRNLKRSQGGLGIGLALARRLIELHSGQIEARSEGPGKGSEFIVHLPCMELASAAASDPAARSHVAGGRRRIMVVDDNRDAATALNMLLQTFGHTTAMAYDGAQAVQMVENFRPEIILMDLGMPHMDGYEAARKIRENPWGKSIVMVALSGWGQEDDRRKARDAGFDHHFTKPVDIDVILALVSPQKNNA